MSDDRLSLFNYQDSLLRLKAGRRLKQTQSALTGEAPTMVLDLVEKSEFSQHWDYKRKVWDTEAHSIFEFKVEPDAVPYVVPVVRRVLRSMYWEGEGTISTHFSLSLFGYDKQKQERLMKRWFPPEPEAIEEEVLA